MPIRHAILALFALLSLSCAGAHAGFVLSPTSVSTSVGTQVVLTGNDVNNIINRSGLSIPFGGQYVAEPYAGTHADADFPAAANNVWVGTSPTGTLTFDLGAIYNVTGFRLWNSSYTTGGAFGDVANFNLVADTDNNPGNGGTTTLLTNQATSLTKANPKPMESFNFANINTRFVHFTVNSTDQGANMAIGEIAFVVSAVPEPSTMSLLGVALVAGGVARRFKKKRAA